MYLNICAEMDTGDTFIPISFLDATLPPPQLPRIKASPYIPLLIRRARGVRGEPEKYL
jgi:hypothetical protein